MVRGVSGVPGEGPYIVLELEIQGETVGIGTFESNGCPAAHKAACTVLTIVKGRDRNRVVHLEPSDLELLAGPLPDGKGFYYQMAIDALRDGLKQAETTS